MKKYRWDKKVFNEEINQNELISKSIKKFVEFWITLNACYFSFSITGCVSISAFSSLVAIPIGIVSSEVGLKIYVTTSGIKSINQ